VQNRVCDGLIEAQHDSPLDGAEGDTTDVGAASEKREDKKTWLAKLTSSQATAKQVSQLIPIEERIALLRASARETAAIFLFACTASSRASGTRP